MKRILVIEKCDCGCPFTGFSEEKDHYFCVAEAHKRFLDPGEEIPEWCPLPKAERDARGEK